MFALSLWDAKERRLHLARDRFGEKPLYYGWVGGDFVFASELSAIQLHPRFDNRIDRRALQRFAARNYVPAPLSIYRRIYKLQPGCILTASVEAAANEQATPMQPGFVGSGLKIERYWSYRQTLLDGLDDPIEDEDTALEELEAALSASGDGTVAGRRAGRRLPLRRHRFLDGRRALPEIFHPAGANLHDRLRGSGL